MHQEWAHRCRTSFRPWASDARIDESSRDASAHRSRSSRNSPLHTYGLADSVWQQPGAVFAFDSRDVPRRQPWRLPPSSLPPRNATAGHARHKHTPGNPLRTTSRHRRRHHVHQAHRRSHRQAPEAEGRPRVLQRPRHVRHGQVASGREGPRRRCHLRERGPGVPGPRLGQAEGARHGRHRRRGRRPARPVRRPVPDQGNRGQRPVRGNLSAAFRAVPPADLGLHGRCRA